MNKKAKKAVKIVAITLGSLLGLLVLTVVAYLLYVVFDYSRIDDDIVLEVRNNQASTLSVGGEYTVMTYNIGFGAYGPDYSFFMDTGKMKDGTETTGEYGTAKSYDDVVKNVSGSAEIVKSRMPDFAIIQEVDYGSTRSYSVDERAYFTEIGGYGSVFAENYHSSYLMYPFDDPHGANNAGIVTLSKYGITESRRYSFPIDDGFGKYLDLDRCYSVTRMPVGDKEFVLISLHMSAYDEGGVIRKQQAEKLKGVLEAEYAKGNYVIAGGDFNQDLIGDLDKFPSAQEIPPWISTYDQADIPSGFSIVADNSSSVGSCRGADITWERDYTYTCVIDGFIVSDNIKVNGCEIIDADFAYSDHNPVELKFEFIA